MSLDASLLLLHAEEFRRAAITLEGNQIDRQLMDEHTFIPMSVCHAFAFELYLKFLILTQSDQDPPRDHNLRKLYSKLPKGIADRIRELWENPKPGQLAMRMAIAEATGKPHPNFDETLDQSSDAFQRLRYAYEYDQSALQFIGGDIEECCRRAIFEMYPTEYASVRLPLPSGAFNADYGNSVVTTRVQHPARCPPNS